MDASLPNSTFPTSLFNDTDNGSGRRYSTGFGPWRGRGRYDDLGPTTRASVWVLVGASFLFILLRVYCKLVKHRRLHADDHFAVAAWVSLQHLETHRGTKKLMSGIACSAR